MAERAQVGRRRRPGGRGPSPSSRQQPAVPPATCCWTGLQLEEGELRRIELLAPWAVPLPQLLSDVVLELLQLALLSFNRRLPRR